MNLSRRLFLALGAALATGIRPAFAFALPTRPPGSPYPSDVCFSSRWTNNDAIAIGRAFEATRLDWCYTADRSFIANAKAAGMSAVGATVNSVLPAAVGGKNIGDGWILDAAGNRVTNPRMKVWNVYWGCVNNPIFQSFWQSRIREGLAAGADSIFVDDPGMNAVAVQWGGCFCQYCKAAAEQQGLLLPRDMSKLQRASVVRFHENMRAYADKVAGRRVGFGYNCGPGTGLRDWLTGNFDFRICELDADRVDPVDIASRLMSSELIGQPQGFTLRSENVSLNCSLAAWCYANGGHMLAPWDVYLRTTRSGSDRFYGNPKDYADIFPFARKLGRLLDQAAPSALPPPGSWTVNRDDVTVSLRSNPAGSFTVMHLVTWKEPAPYTIEIDPTRVAGARDVGYARLLTGSHGDFAFERNGRMLRVNVPPSTWAVVEMVPS